MQRFKHIGKVKAFSAGEISSSRLGIGFEKLDRGLFDPSKAYDKVADIGVKWIRIQSGWERTEKQKGVYDFAWLDDIVNNLTLRGLTPWICLCYGNGLYNPEAAKVFGGVGIPPIDSREEKDAWANYCTAIAKRYKGKAVHFELWNEPDGVWCWKRTPNGFEYGEFAVATSKALKKGNPDAYVIGGAICMGNMHFIKDAFSVGMGDYIDAISFHRYHQNETLTFDRVDSLKGFLKREGKENIELIQGESGSQSKFGGAGAMSGGMWTERKQAKQLLRQSVADLSTDVVFTSYFSALDMVEALHGVVGEKQSWLDYAYFGVLGADFDENGVSSGEYYKKPSYFALQNLASIFAEDVRPDYVPVTMHREPSQLVFGYDCMDNSIIKCGFSRDNGSFCYCYWNSTDLMTIDYESTITIEVATYDMPIHLIDPYDGSVYEIPDSVIEDHKSSKKLCNIPIRDYPLIIAVGDFAKFE